ncbi:YjbF family lipoprotein [Enterobacter hormaechei]
MFGTPGVHLTDDELQNMPYASQYMQLNDGPQLFVVLAFDENGQQKWVTQDQATIVTQHSRIVKTLLGGDKPAEVNNLAEDSAHQAESDCRWRKLDAHDGLEPEQDRCATPRPAAPSAGRVRTGQSGQRRTQVRVLDEEVTTY